MKQISPEINLKEKYQASVPGVFVVFGSGELSTVGRSIHERIIRNLHAPVKIALLETPTGFQDNPQPWYVKLKTMMEKGLRNYAPKITLVPAFHSDGEESTNNPKILTPLLSADYIHTGAGSPTYALKHLKNSLALKIMKDRLLEGAALSIASACAVAFGKYVIPIYEIYFAGHDPSWVEGLDFLHPWGLNITFIPHWNNREGGKEIDTRFAYMGERRYKQLIQLLPGPTTIIGIDEHTALMFEFNKKSVMVLGKGTATFIKGKKQSVIPSGGTISFDELKL